MVSLFFSGSADCEDPEMKMTRPCVSSGNFGWHARGALFGYTYMPSSHYVCALGRQPVGSQHLRGDPGSLPAAGELHSVG